MGLLVSACAMSVLFIVLSFAIYLLRREIRELRNAHLDLATLVGTVQREGATAAKACFAGIEGLQYCNQQSHAYIKSVEEALAGTDANAKSLSQSIVDLDATAKSLNERLVLLEIEKTATPKPPEEPPPARRSFASQKARAEAGARK